LDRLKETEAALAKEKETSNIVMRALSASSASPVPGSSPSSPSSKDAEIAFLLQQNNLLAQKLDETNSRFERELGLVITRMEGIKTMPAGGANVRRRGL
jgi:hypothetical protein